METSLSKMGWTIRDSTTVPSSSQHRHFIELLLVGRFKFRVQVRARDFCLIRNVQTGCRVHQVSYSVPIEGCSLSVKQLESEDDHSPAYRGTAKNE